MYKEKWGNKKLVFNVVSCIVVMLLAFSALFSFTFAWLSDQVQSPSTGTTNLATITGGSTNSSTSVEITMSQAGNSKNIANNSVITNTGSVGALLRVFYSFTIDEESKQIATTKDFTQVNINVNFVASDENINNVYSGYYFYNNILDAGASISFIDNVYPTSTIAGQKVKLNLYCELVNYQGGPYQLVQELPWQNTPASWFLNQDSLVRTQGSLVSPKLDIKFSEVSKIEITAKTSSTTSNVLIGRYGNAYIGVNGTSWVFNQLVNGTGSITPSAFCNGTSYRTVTFTWASTTAPTDDYISLVTDSSWSKEVSYKQIRIWNKSNELVYDLRPNTTITNNITTSDGKFINKISNTVLPMYTFNNGVTTESQSGYDFIGKVAYYNDFEQSADGTSFVSSYGASSSVVSTTSKNGKKSLKVVNSLNISGVTQSNPASFGIIEVTAKSGYKYSVSMWVKTDATDGTMAYSKQNGNLIAEMPSLKVEGGSTYRMNLDNFGGWTLLSVTTDTLTVDETLKISFVLPTGSTYTTYIDDIVVSIAN